MSTEAAAQKHKLAIQTDEEAYRAYCLYCPDHIYAWDHLTMEERLAWRHVAAHMPAEDRVLEQEQPKVKSLGQICFEAAWEGQPERVWPPIGLSAHWEAAAQAVAVAVLHMRYDEFTPDLKAAAEEGTRRGTDWVEKSEGEQPSMSLLSSSPSQRIIGIVPHHGYHWKVTGSGEEWIAEEVKAD